MCPRSDELCVCRMATHFRAIRYFRTRSLKITFFLRSFFRWQNPYQSLISIKTIHSYQWQRHHRALLQIKRYHASGLAIWPMIEDMSFIQHSDRFTYPCLWCCSSIGASIVRPFVQHVPSIKDSRLPKVSGSFGRFHFYEHRILRHLACFGPNHLEHKFSLHHVWFLV